MDSGVVPSQETEDGFIRTDVFAYRDPYRFDNGSGIRVTRRLGEDGLPNGDFMFEIRIGDEAVRALLTPADVAALHQQALKGNVVHVQ